MNSIPNTDPIKNQGVNNDIQPKEKISSKHVRNDTSRSKLMHCAKSVFVGLLLASSGPAAAYTPRNQIFPPSDDVCPTHGNLLINGVEHVITPINPSNEETTESYINADDESYIDNNPNHYSDTLFGAVNLFYQTEPVEATYDETWYEWVTNIFDKKTYKIETEKTTDTERKIEALQTVKDHILEGKEIEPSTVFLMNAFNYVYEAENSKFTNFSERAARIQSARAAQHETENIIKEIFASDTNSEISLKVADVLLNRHHTPHDYSADFRIMHFGRQIDQILYKYLEKVISLDKFRHENLNQEIGSASGEKRKELLSSLEVELNKKLADIDKVLDILNNQLDDSFTINSFIFEMASHLIPIARESKDEIQKMLVDILAARDHSVNSSEQFVLHVPEIDRLKTHFQTIKFLENWIRTHSNEDQEGQWRNGIQGMIGEITSKESPESASVRIDIADSATKALIDAMKDANSPDRLAHIIGRIDVVVRGWMLWKDLTAERRLDLLTIMSENLPSIPEQYFTLIDYWNKSGLNEAQLAVLQTILDKRQS